MPLRDHAIPSLHHSHEAGHPLKAVSMIYVPSMRLCLTRRINSELISNIVKRTLGIDFSTMQTINPTLVFLSTSTTTPKFISCTESHITASKSCPFASAAGISSTRLLNPLKENPEKSDDTTVYINDTSLLNYHDLRKQSGYDLDVKSPGFNRHKRKFNCTIIDCRKNFKR
jgi:hypothetical protein